MGQLDDAPVMGDDFASASGSRVGSPTNFALLAPELFQRIIQVDRRVGARRVDVGFDLVARGIPGARFVCAAVPHALILLSAGTGSEGDGGTASLVLEVVEARDR